MRISSLLVLRSSIISLTPSISLAWIIPWWFGSFYFSGCRSHGPFSSSTPFWSTFKISKRWFSREPQKTRNWLSHVQEDFMDASFVVSHDEGLKLSKTASIHSRCSLLFSHFKCFPFFLFFLKLELRLRSESPARKMGSLDSIILLGMVL